MWLGWPYDLMGMNIERELIVATLNMRGVSETTAASIKSIDA